MQRRKTQSTWSGETFGESPKRALTLRLDDTYECVISINPEYTDITSWPLTGEVVRITSPEVILAISSQAKSTAVWGFWLGLLVPQISVERLWDVLDEYLDGSEQVVIVLCFPGQKMEMNADKCKPVKSIWNHTSVRTKTSGCLNWRWK